MKKLVEWCDKGMDVLVNFNGGVVCEHAPKFLAKFPKPIATIIWLPCAVFWVIVAGPITYAVEAVLFPFVAWAEAGVLGWRRLRDTLCMCGVMTLCFWGARFGGCIAMFQIGIWDRSALEVD